VTLDLTVLGSSGIYATRERACSGYLVRTDEHVVLLDCGAGVWRNLLDHTDHASIDGVILSHRHPDHVSDLFMLLHARLYGQAEPLPEIPLWAPAETLERLTAFSKELDQAFRLTSISTGDQISVGAAEFSFFSMAHPPDTVGVRVEKDGAVLAYSSDTGPTGDLEGLANGADVLLCEATLQNSDETWEGHMSASQAGEAAAGAGVGKLVLTHLPPGRDAGLSLTEAHKTSGGAEVQLAADGLKLEVGS
jgi:ribonuclease BN (tRNA processing enzyme)